MHSFLKIINLSKSYPPPKGGTSSPVFAGVNLSVASGQSLAIVGPSGSGKSTLLNLIGGIDQPDQGKILMEGQSISDLSPEDSAHFRNQAIGFVFQSHHLLPALTALENVMIPALAGHEENRNRELRADAIALLGEVGLSERINHLPGQLSGGERQRVALARSLINNPKLLLADEPTGALDHENAETLIDLLLALKSQRQLSIVLVTHSLKFAHCMDEVWSFENGCLKSVAR